MKKEQKITIKENGPYIVTGGIPLRKEIATVTNHDCPEKWVKGKKYPLEQEYELCRCGNSCNKPYCDGSHRKGFNGTETASDKPYVKQATRIKGPELELMDAQELCASARFCHLAGGTWKNTQESNKPECKKTAIKTACNCPSGRLVIIDKKTGKAIEPELKKTISLIEDPQNKVSGGIWVKGGIKIESANGKEHECRNRVTLCRCGKSKNKPYCDGSHIDTGFTDEK